MDSKKWSLTITFTTVVLLIFVMIFNYIIDPFFHFHRPKWGLQYRLSENQRYVNDGILRNFTYDAIITGTSMARNFYTSEFDQLFGTSSVKVCFDGATFKEVDEAVNTAIERNPEIKIVLRTLDGNMFLLDKDAMKLDSYPEYLYDDNIFNDVNYLLNIAVIKESLSECIYNIQGGRTTSFDDYLNMKYLYSSGRGDEIIRNYQRSSLVNEEKVLSYGERMMLYENVEQNLVATARENPNIKFIYFIPPYSCLFWDDLKRTGKIEWYLEQEEIVFTLLATQSNVEIYSFNTEFDMVCNLDHYYDARHYDEEFSSRILYWVSKKENQITSDNINIYLNKLREYYSNFDFDALYLK